MQLAPPTLPSLFWNYHSPQLHMQDKRIEHTQEHNYSKQNTLCFTTVLWLKAFDVTFIGNNCPEKSTECPCIHRYIKNFPTSKESIWYKMNFQKMSCLHYINIKQTYSVSLHLFPTCCCFYSCSAQTFHYLELPVQLKPSPSYICSQTQR